MSYAGKFSQRNANAARDWAAERQQKINRAKQLREERARGSVERDPECTFTPQKFNSYEPTVGSSKFGNVSDYSQEYLRNFHFQPRDDERYGQPEQPQQPQPYDPSSRDQSRQQYPPTYDEPGRSYPAREVLEHKYSGPPQGSVYGSEPYSQSQHQFSSQQPHQPHQPQQHAHHQYLGGQGTPGKGQMYNTQIPQPHYSAPVYDARNYQEQVKPRRPSAVNNAGQMIANTMASPYRPSNQTLSPRQVAVHSNRSSNEGGFGGSSYQEDALSHEMHRHSGTAQAFGGEQHAHDLSYEFAASAHSISRGQSSRHLLGGGSGGRGANTQRQAHAEHTQRTQQQSNMEYQYRAQNHAAANKSGTGQAQYNSSDCLNTLKNRPSRSSHAGSRAEQQAEAKVKRTASARPALGAMCTRQSGCTCAQCQAESVFQEQSGSGGVESSFNAANENATQASSTRSRRRRPIDERPPWNNAFDDDVETADSQDPPAHDMGHVSNPNLSSNSNSNPNSNPNPSSRRRSSQPGPRRRNSRPEWQGTVDEPTEQSDQSAHSEEQTQAMRENLRGGKNDFIEQAHQRDSRGGYGSTAPNARASSLRPSASANAPQYGAYQQPQSASTFENKNRGRPVDNRASGSVQAPYRGMYMPPQEENPQAISEETIVGPQGGSGPGVDVPEYAPPAQLEPCSLCGRKFNADRIEKHMNACAKAQQKRKKFDTTKKRLEGVATNPDDKRIVLDALQSKNKAKSVAKAKADKAAKWKRDSMALREAMKYNKEISKAQAAGIDISTLPPPTSSVHDDLVPCSNCGRTFSEQAAKRHIPLCKNQKAKPNRLLRGGGTNASKRVVKRR
mmetsp:Transcript_14163/g.25331  ORF Transcript_14163/g.25331 Transcript_14163/m.25331 type:complete len:841 (-) Transcript_14163:248-2770(-)